MNKFQIKELKQLIIDWSKYWKWNNTFFGEMVFLKELIIHLLEDSNYWENNYSDLDAEVFWKLSIENKRKLFNYIDWKIEDKEVKKEIFIIWKKIIELLSSIYSEVPNIKDNNVETKILQEMRISWQALERFIIYAINFFWTDKNLNIKKSKAEYEGKKIDFISEYNIYWENTKIIFANQLTANKNPVDKKKQIHALAYFIDNPEEDKSKKTPNLTRKNYRKENIPDLPILFSVQNWLRNLAHNDNWHNDFYKSYQELWKVNPMKNIWKNKKSKTDNLQNLESIWTSYETIISYIIKKIQKIDLSKETSQSNVKKWIWYINFHYTPTDNIFKVTFIKNYKTEYKLFFYITDKFLKKIWVNYNIDRKLLHNKQKD